MLAPSDQFQYIRYTLLSDQPNRFYMTQFKIKRSLLPVKHTRHKYMYQDGRIDYLGQFLIQLGYQINGKYRFPSELNKVITPFTQASRGAVIDSVITLRILELDYTSTQEHPARLRALLPNWQIDFVP